MRPNDFHNLDFAFTQAVIGMAIISLDGTFLELNSALYDLLGVNQNEANILPPSILPLQEQVREIVLDAKFKHMTPHPFEFELDYEHPSGHRLFLTINSSMIVDNTGIPQYYFAQFVNKTLIRQMESKLQDSEIHLLEKEDTFIQLLEELPLTVLITKQGIIQYMNPAGLQLIHAENLDAVIGMSTNSIVDLSYSAILADRRKKHYSGQPVGSVRYLINCVNNQQKYIDGSSLPITYKGDSAILGIFKDISDQVLEEERLIQSEKLSTAGQLAAGIAHEIRNPLTAINGFMKLLRSSERINDRYFSIIESELQRIEFIVNELLVLAKPQAKHISKPFDFLVLLEQVITLMNGQASLKSIKILPVCTDQSLWVYGEAYQLKQVFINLLKNAMEAMNDGGNIYVQVLTNERDARISVQDEGCGMTEDQIKKLGKPFYTTKETGTGLGFMITQNIIHNHGGSIVVESVLNQGTTFTVIIPTISGPEDAAI